MGYVLSMTKVVVANELGWHSEHRLTIIIMGLSSDGCGNGYILVNGKFYWWMERYHNNKSVFK